MKGFGIYVKNDLLEPKHVEAFGSSSLWLYLWLLDKMTSVSEDGTGKTLGGAPIKYELIKEELGISERSYRKYVKQLRDKKYIDTTRTMYGLVITVNKATKIFNNKRDVRDQAHPDVRDRVIPQAKLAHPTSKVGTSNKTIQVTTTKTIQTNVEVQKNIRLVFETFVNSFNKNQNQYKLSDHRKLKIKARIKDAGVDMLTRAIKNTAASNFHRGDNERGWQADLDFIIRSYEQVERLANMNSASNMSIKELEKTMESVL